MDSDEISSWHRRKCYNFNAVYKLVVACCGATSGAMAGGISRGSPLDGAGAGCCCCLFLFLVRGGEKGAGATASSNVATNAHMLRRT